MSAVLTALTTLTTLTMDDVARLADLGEIGDDLYACLLLADRQSARAASRDANL